jgi:hypothetical protein
MMLRFLTGCLEQQTYKFIFGQLTGLVDDTGCSLHDFSQVSSWLIDSSQERVDSLAGIENTEYQNLTGAAEMKTGNIEAPLSLLPPPPDGNGNTCSQAMMNLSVHLTALHTALPPCIALLFSEHSDPCPMPTPATRHAEYQRAAPTAGVALGPGGSAVGWSRVNNLVLEEAIIWAQTRLLFVGIKTEDYLADIILSYEYNCNHTVYSAAFLVHTFKKTYVGKTYYNRKVGVPLSGKNKRCTPCKKIRSWHPLGIGVLIIRTKERPN